MFLYIKLMWSVCQGCVAQGCVAQGCVGVLACADVSSASAACEPLSWLSDTNLWLPVPEVRVCAAALMAADSTNR